MEQFCVNCDETSKNRQFALSALSVEEWRDAVMAVLLELHKTLKGIKLTSFVVNVRNNVALLKISYNINSINSVTFQNLDEFGFEMNDYKGYASDCFRGIMSEHYGKKYDDALCERFNSSIQVVEL